MPDSLTSPSRSDLAFQTTDLSTQRALVDDSDPDVQYALATNPHLHALVLDLLVHHDLKAIRCYVADTSTLPHAAACVLSRDPEASVRSSLAYATQYVDVQDLLATDPAPWVRHSLAQNCLLSENAARVLAGDTDPTVRRLLARRPVSVLSAHMPLTFWQEHAPLALEGLLRENELDADWATLADNWIGTVHELLQAYAALTTSCPLLVCRHPFRKCTPKEQS